MFVNSRCFFQKNRQSYNLNPLILLQFKQVPVASHDHIYVAGYGTLQDSVIRFINYYSNTSARLQNCCHGCHMADSRFHTIRFPFEFNLKFSGQFGENRN